MARAGQTISNPITHEEITFLKTARETDGKLLVFDCRVAPGGIPLPAHPHGSQQERITVISEFSDMRASAKSVPMRPAAGSSTYAFAGMPSAT